LKIFSETSHLLLSCFSKYLDPNPLKRFNTFSYDIKSENNKRKFITFLFFSKKENHPYKNIDNKTPSFPLYEAKT